MNYRKYESILTVFDTEDALPAQEYALLQQARQQLINAYAPYSEFHVACALQLGDNKVITGTNQENIAYPSGLCAERVAIFNAGHLHPHTMPVAIAITAQSGKGVVSHPPTSCGACLQVMAEYEQRFKTQLKIILAGETGPVYVAEGVRTFMPWQFETDLV
jgi:cytidine deaminase